MSGGRPFEVVAKLLTLKPGTGGYTAGGFVPPVYEEGLWELEIAINYPRLIQLYGARAAGQVLGRAVLLHGAVKIKATRKGEAT